MGLLLWYKLIITVLLETNVRNSEIFRLGIKIFFFLAFFSVYFLFVLLSTMCHQVIDEIYRVLRYVNSTRAPQRAHEVLQELRDISSMAMEYFDEKIVPILKKKLPGADLSGRLIGSAPGQRRLLNAPFSSENPNTCFCYIIEMKSNETIEDNIRCC